MATVFLVLGVCEGTWASRIPDVKAGLHLSAGVLGLALLGPALGCVAAMPAAGAVLASVPPRRVTQAGLLLLSALLPLTTQARSAWQLGCVLAGWGAGIGIVDVAMNTEAAAVQDRIGRRVMAGFHGAYSVGGLVGSGVGAVTAAAGVTAGATFLAAGIAMAAAGIGAAQVFASSPAHRRAGGLRRASRWPQWSKALVALGAMALASFLGEGAAGNWSAVYLRTSLGASPAVAAFGFAAFACAMTAGRLAGDRLADLLGPVRLVRLGAGLATAGFGGALLVGRVWSGVAGFALLGAGLSVVVPLAFTASARLGRAGPNLAMVTSCGYLGALAGPAVIGSLADLTSLPAALGVVVVAGVAIAALAGAVRPGRPAEPAASAARPGDEGLPRRQARGESVPTESAELGGSAGPSGPVADPAA